MELHINAFVTIKEMHLYICVYRDIYIYTNIYLSVSSQRLIYYYNVYSKISLIQICH